MGSRCGDIYPSMQGRHGGSSTAEKSVHRVLYCVYYLVHEQVTSHRTDRLAGPWRIPSQPASQTRSSSMAARARRVDSLSEGDRVNLWRLMIILYCHDCVCILRGPIDSPSHIASPIDSRITGGLALSVTYLGLTSRMPQS